MSYQADSKGVYHSLGKSAEELPDNLDVYSFMFDYFPKSRPDVRKTGLGLIVDEETGNELNFEQLRQRVDLLSLGLYERIGVRPDTRIGLFSPNTFDYPTAVWATHRIGGIVSPANPSFGASELSYQLDSSKATVLFLHEVSKQAGFESAQKAKIKRENIVLLQDPAHVEELKQKNNGKIVRQIEGSWTLVGLLEEAKEILQQKSQKALDSCRHTLKPGEGHKKLAFLSFSSGTTGLPKGVAIQHYAPVSNVLQFFHFNQCSNKIGERKGRYRAGVDAALGILPMFHIYGLVLGLHGMMYMGVKNIIMPRFKGIVPMIETALKYRASIWFLVPPQCVLFCKDPEAKKLHEQCRKLVNSVMIGAAPLSDDLSKQFEQALPGVDWGQGYGMTETCTLTLQHPVNMTCVSGSAGRLVSNVEARIVTPEGKDCGLDQPGELWIRSPSNTLGYSNNADATKEMWVEGGWVRTGDEAKVNKDGDFFIVDRLKELIKVKGFQVPPAELEGWLLNHNDVSDAMVVGIPDEAAGERPLAFVTLTANAMKKVNNDAEQVKKMKESIMKHVSENKIRYKHLKHVEIIDAIPKTASGKILRRTGREMAKKLIIGEEEGNKSRL